jgi:hypothetical protein
VAMGRGRGDEFPCAPAEPLVHRWDAVTPGHKPPPRATDFGMARVGHYSLSNGKGR